MPYDFSCHQKRYKIVSVDQVSIGYLVLSQFANGEETCDIEVYDEDYCNAVTEALDSANIEFGIDGLVYKIIHDDRRKISVEPILEAFNTLKIYN